jgi:hypothetical protein
MGDKRAIKRAGGCVVWLAALALPACGGSSSSASCGSQTACGGNVVGTWKVESSCSSTSSSYRPFAIPSSGEKPNFCSSTLSASGLTVSGTLTFGSDSTYSFTLVEGGSIRYTVPSWCPTGLAELAQAGANGASCSALGADVGMSCQASGGNCLCDLKLVTQTDNESGTYSVAGTNLTLMPTTGGAATTNGFCATSSELHVSEVDDTGMVVVVSPTVSSELVATKQ